MQNRLIKSFLAAASVAGMTAAIPAPAVAQNNFGQAVVGGLILCGLTNCTNQRRSTRTAPRGNETVRMDQQALNYFGWNVGTADGVTGNKTRNGIRQYQSYMGYPVTGQLDDYQRANLQNAYAWGQSGRASAYPGVYGPELLRAYGAEARGEVYCPQSAAGNCGNGGAYGGNGGVYGNNGGIANGGGLAGGTVGNGGVAPDLPNQVIRPGTDDTTLVGTTNALPSFDNLSEAPQSKSMASHCLNAQILTGANGGKISSPGQITDATLAMDEQFCGARDDAIAKTDQVTSGANIGDSQLASACGQVVTQMQAQIDALDALAPAQITQNAGDMAATAGWSKDMMMQTGEICLGYGYRVDDPQTVLAASMLLVGAGATPYAEVFGHHKRLGFGTLANPDMATAWYDNAFGALDQGVPPAFLPAQSQQRVAIMRAAMGGSAQSATALPSFNIGGN